MGKTNPTYRDRLRRLENDWETFRRALRREDQEHFDQLFKQARNFADAAGYQNKMTMIEPFLVSVVLAQEERIAELEERVEERKMGARDD